MVRLNILPLRCCRLALSCADRSAVDVRRRRCRPRSAACTSAWRGGRRGWQRRQNHPGPGRSRWKCWRDRCRAPPGGAGGGTIGTAAGLTDGGTVVPGVPDPSSNTERRAVTYGPVPRIAVRDRSPRRHRGLGGWALTAARKRLERRRSGIGGSRRALRLSVVDHRAVPGWFGGWGGARRAALREGVIHHRRWGHRRWGHGRWGWPLTAGGGGGTVDAGRGQTALSRRCARLVAQPCERTIQVEVEAGACVRCFSWVGARPPPRRSRGSS